MITLNKTTLSDAKLIHAMQLKAFELLLRTYQDYDTNPGNEAIERIVSRINQPHSIYYLIKMDKEIVGAIRVLELDEGKKCRISPIFVLPQFQNKGIGQRAMQLAETLYPNAAKWVLGTILEEKGNCHLYEKMGYCQTGETKRLNEKLTLVFYEKNLGRQ